MDTVTAAAKPAFIDSLRDRVRGLRCRNCNAHFPKVYLRRCPSCQGLLVVQYDWERLQTTALDALGGPGVWRYWPLLPVTDPAHFVSLEEGNTPLLRVPRLGAALGLRDFWIKYEGTNPTGTFKDRSSATAVGTALEFGFWATALVTTGNGGSAVATYSARAGLTSFIFAPTHSAQPKLQHMAACATELVLVEGDYDAISRTYKHLIEQVDGVFDCGGLASPYKLEGKKTLSYEVAESFGWQAPDVVVCPVGTGDQFVAAWLGFGDLVRLGWTERAPQMVCVQSTVADSIVAAWREGHELRPQRAGRTVAEGVAIGDPGAKGEWILDILRQANGLGVAPGDDEILAAQRLLAKTEGVWAGPTGAIAVAGAARLAREGQLDPDARVVCIVSETGLKGEYPPLQRAATPPELDAWLAIIAEHRDVL